MEPLQGKDDTHIVLYVIAKRQPRGVYKIYITKRPSAEWSKPVHQYWCLSW